MDFIRMFLASDAGIAAAVPLTMFSGFTLRLLTGRGGELIERLLGGQGRG